MAIPDYKLSAVLTGHSLDVRGISATKEDCILSASRDKTAKLWHPEGIKDFSNVVTYKGHTNFVSSICWLPPCEPFPEGLVLTGSNDNKVLGFPLQGSAATLELDGHENAVCCVATSIIPGTVLSSSWDNTGCIWNLNVSPATRIILKGHQAAVWSIIEINNGNIVTGSADKAIFMWNKEGCKIKTLTGHTDCVRGLTVASVETFLSCANDATIRLWTNEGQCINTFFGHNNYIYCVSMNPAVSADCFVTSGEDSTVRVWAGGENLRTITLPASSVWCVTCLSNGDIVTGSSDGIIRVFSKEPARHADEKVLLEFEQEVQKVEEAARTELGGVKLSDLPGPEVLYEPGKTDGQTKMVRRGTNVKCYSWSAADQTWNELGDVMGAAGPAEGKTQFQGKDYDYVFSVDIEEGAPPLKLPYNKSEDPWLAAQTFIHKHQLPQTYLEQVANFIVTNSEQAPVAPTNGTYFDPFTGASRYVPGSEAAVGSGGGSRPNADPFTGASRYVPGTGAAMGAGNESRTRPNSDPFTGASSYSTQAAKQDSSLIPHKTYLRFDQASLDKILEKLKQFNDNVGDGLVSMSDEDLESVVKLGETVPSCTIENITRLKNLLSWPQDKLFPVLDITRLAVRHAELNCDLFGESYATVLLAILLHNLNPDNLPANQILALRVLVNAFAHLPGEMAVLKEHENIINCLICLTDLNKNAQIAAATLLLNLSVALGQQQDSFLGDCVIQMLSRYTDHEAYFRGLIALGTILVESPDKIALRTKIVSNTQLVNRLKTDSTNLTQSNPVTVKISACSRDILRLL